MWKTFRCRNLGDYHNLYVATDTLLLADIFENFRDVCLNKYGLDPAHSYNSPGLSWDALLKKTGAELELLTSKHAPFYRERYEGRNLDAEQTVCKGEQSPDWISPEQANKLYNILRCKQSLWLGDEPATAEKRLQVEVHHAHRRTDHENEAAFKEGADS